MAQSWQTKSITMNESPCSRLQGIAALLFAGCPTVELGLMMLSDYVRGHGDHMPVGVGVPPLSVFLLVGLALSSPWIAAGLLLLRSHPAGRWLAVVLTVPTVPLVLLSGGGALHGFCWVWIIEHNPAGFMTGLVFGPFAGLGSMFCLTVWIFQFSYWQNRKKPSDPSRFAS